MTHNLYLNGKLEYQKNTHHLILIFYFFLIDRENLLLELFIKVLGKTIKANYIMEKDWKGNDIYLYICMIDSWHFDFEDNNLKYNSTF